MSAKDLQIKNLNFETKIIKLYCRTYQLNTASRVNLKATFSLKEKIKLISAEKLGHMNLRVDSKPTSRR